MDIEILRTAIKVAELKSIPDAADDLFISHSSIVNRIKVFEQSVGTKVFLRRGRGIEITDEGLQLLPYVRKTISILNEGVEGLKNFHTSNDTIKIAAAPTVASYTLPAYLKEFKKDFPELTIHVKTAASTTILDWINNGKIDFGFVKGPLFYSGLESLSISSDPIILIVNKNHPWTKKEFITPDDFKNQVVIPFNRQTRYWSLIDRWFSTHNVQPTISMEFDHPETIKQMVFQNFGVAFVPSSVIEDSISKKHIQVMELLPPLELKRETYVICNSNKTFSSKSKMFWDFLSNHVKQKTTV